jgi:hypothetical protein
VLQTHLRLGEFEHAQTGLFDFVAGDFASAAVIEKEFLQLTSHHA